MTSLTSNEEDRCSVCGKILSASGHEEWFTEAGEMISISKFDEIYINADLSSGEMILCEHCYKSRKFDDLSNNDIAEIHYQFGLEYSHAHRPADSIIALRNGLRLKGNADILASIAKGYGDLGEYESARDFYQQALDVDPNHFMAKQNLRNLQMMEDDRNQ